VFARKHRRPTMRLSERVRPVLLAHPWPGNVRELEYAIERAVVMSRDDIVDGHELGLEAPRAPTGAMAAVGLPAALVDAAGGVVLPDGLPLEEAERRYAVATLARVLGNQSEAARVLGISRNRLARLLRG